jgi:betaine reductase
MAVVIKEVGYILAAVPDFVPYGSKPERDLEENESVRKDIYDRLRSYEDVVNYAPNQVFIGNMMPEDLHDIPKPWYDNLLKNGTRKGGFGEILPEEEFYGWLKAADDFDLLWLTPEFTDTVKEALLSHPFVGDLHAKRLGQGKPEAKIQEVIANGSAAPLWFHGNLVGSIRRDHDKDDTLKSVVLLENLMAKASGVFAMKHMLKRAGMEAADVEFVLDCTETAIGDRYNRGGGSLSKAMAEMCGCNNATGHDVRAFCCAPNHALITAAGLVESGIYRNVVVTGGGCLSKIGMKYAAHLKKGMPILEDVLGGISFLITKDDGESPMIRLDALGKHDVGVGSAQQSIMTSLIIKPLQKIGMKMTEIDKFSTELHNPEITLPAGSGDTPATNYGIMAALAAMNGHIEKTKEEMDGFVKKRGMPGYCPTQGHIPSAVPYIGHAIEAMKTKRIKRAMFVAKGSLFLGRMSQLSDGVSFILEANDQ